MHISMSVLALINTATRCHAYSILAFQSSPSFFFRTSKIVRLKLIENSKVAHISYKNELSMSSDGSNEPDDKEDSLVKPTWVYTPYKPPSKSGGQRRTFSNSRNDNWIVPKTIDIPEDKIDFSFVRSSGAGGQNVNKVNTQACLKFHVMDADWIPREVRDRIVQNEVNRINKEGCMIINSQEYRTQTQNRKDALDKLEQIILKHYPRPKIRKMRKGISQKSKTINKENKRKLSEKKQNRKRVDF